MMPSIKMSEEEGLINFLKMTGRLKKEPRRGWVLKAGVSNPESVADHTFRLILLSMMLGDLRGLNTEKMMKLAIIHDLGESLIGDITPEDKDKVESKELDEVNAIKQLFSHLPDNLRENYSHLWTELGASSSAEAKLVHDADKLEMALQASEYMDEGYSKEMLSEFKVSAIEKIGDKKMLDLIRHI
jgi:putative hydrolase of HD superfamily|tara:strand:- start:188 stop:745 length:558 start_codon:yes stop_codon:yes gene_type:complete